MLGKGWLKDTDVHVAACSVLSDAECVARFGAAPLPDAYDRLSSFVYVRNQSGCSGCTAFTTTGAVFSYLHARGVDCPLWSPVVPYGLSRQLAGHRDPLPDSGAYAYLAIEAAMRYGFVPESAMPFFGADLSREIDVRTMQLASQLLIDGFSRLSDDIDEAHEQILRHLASDEPVPIGLMIGKDFERYRKGLGPVGVEDGPLEGHMVFFTGYEDGGEVLKGPSSWDRDYGDEGFFRIHRSKLAQSSDRYSLSMKVIR